MPFFLHSSMKKSPTKVLISMLLLTLAIFLIDLFFNNGAMAGFYICVILISHTLDDDWLIIGTLVLSLFLTFIAYFITNDVFSLESMINKFLIMAMITAVSLLVANRRDTETKLKRANETLELRVLARTAASEAKSKRLEQQIKVLQTIRQNNTDASYQALDDVINSLKDLSVDKDEHAGR